MVQSPLQKAPNSLKGSPKAMSTNKISQDLKSISLLVKDYFPEE